MGILDTLPSKSLANAPFTPENLKNVLKKFEIHILPKLERLKAVVQTGIREGSTLLNHILQGIAAIATISELLQLDIDRSRLLIAAFTLHDLNKLPENKGKSLGSIVRDPLQLAQHRQDLGIDDFLEGADKHVHALRFLIENTSDEHAKMGDTFLGNLSVINTDAQQLARRLRPIMIAADIRDLSSTLEEQHFKDRVAYEISRASDETIHIVRHRLTEHAGTLSQMIHYSAEQCLREAKAFPFWIFPEGSAYLIKASDFERLHPQK